MNPYSLLLLKSADLVSFMPSTLVLNADRNVRPALGTWIDNNTDVLLGFSLRIAEDVLAQLQFQVKETSLNIQPTLAIEKGGDIALAAEILDGEVRLDSFFLCQHGRISSVLASPLVRAALLNDLPIALNPATASALVRGVKGSRRGFLIFNPVAGQGDPPNTLGVLPFKRRLERLRNRASHPDRTLRGKKTRSNHKLKATSTKQWRGRDQSEQNEQVAWPCAATSRFCYARAH